MKYKNRIAALLLAGLLLCALLLTAYAHEVPDESKCGTITVEMEYDGKAVTGGRLAAYRVGQIQEEDGKYSFVKTADMASFPGDYDGGSLAALAEDVADFVEAHDIHAQATAENTAGRAVFAELELGLYLIVQTESADGYEPLKPFLVSVPLYEDGHYVYEIDAAGKFQLRPKNTDNPKEPTTPQKPTGSTLPKTGQLNWPVPVLVVLGLMLFAAGWLLRFGKKKGSYEK